MNNWRLCGTLAIAYIDSTGEIHLADSEQKGCVKELDKLIKDGGKKYTVENTGFSIRITGDYYLSVSHPELGEKEYILNNSAQIIDLMKVISDPTVKINGGHLEGNNWSFVIDPNKNFLPAKEGMLLYDMAEVEMMKRFTIGSSSKTSKWVPGYRYDDETTSIYYLGTVGSWKKDNKYSLVSQSSDVYMVLEGNDFRPTAGQSIEDIIKENFFKIKFKTKRNNLVKSTKPFATGTEVTCITDLWEPIVKKWIKENKTTYSSLSNLIYYKSNPGYLFELFKYTYSKEIPLLSPKTKEMVETVLKDYLKYILVRYWNKKGSFIGSIWFGDKRSPEENSKNLVQAVYQKLEDPNNYDKELYFSTLFSGIGVDVENLSAEVLSLFEPTKMSDTWEHYLNNIPNVEENPDGKFCETWIDESSSSPRDYFYYNSSSRTAYLDSLEEPYKTVLKDVFEYCKNVSRNPEDYIVKNRGTLTKPKYVEQFRVTLETINEMYGGNIPSNITEALIKGKFLKLTYIRDLK